MFRGIETILAALLSLVFTQRICGVCTTVHAISSVRAVEDALGITITDNARLVRNLLEAAQYVQDHVIHFFHLHALDWVDVVSALSADPAQTSALARSISPWPNSSPEYFSGYGVGCKVCGQRQFASFTWALGSPGVSSAG
jgi:Ni,Fe-hydrogenase I large subunit